MGGINGTTNVLIPISKRYGRHSAKIVSRLLTPSHHLFLLVSLVLFLCPPAAAGEALSGIVTILLPLVFPSPLLLLLLGTVRCPSSCPWRHLEKEEGEVGLLPRQLLNQGAAEEHKKKNRE